MERVDAEVSGMLRLLRAERSLVRIRWFGAVFCIFQIWVYYLPYPPGVFRGALSLWLAFVMGTLVIQLAVRRVGEPGGASRLALATLIFDVAVVLGFVFLYAFDVDTGLWAAIYMLPLEGAIKFQFRGALATMAASAGLYGLSELYGAAAYGNSLALSPISFRIGIGFIIAGVAGAMAKNLLQERDAVQRLSDIKDDFLAMTNHELRTPLTTILGYAAMLRRRCATMAESHKLDAIEQIGQQAERLRDLVEDLLTLSSAQAGALHVQVSPVQVRAAVQDAVSQLMPTDSVVNQCPDHLWVLADPQRLSQILTNYLSNARKYGAPPIIIDAWDQDSDVIICVSDAGPGVPAQFVPRLFEKFSQASVGASRTAEGTGLGLAIVRQLAEAQGGTVWYEPGQRQGARFCIRLPIAPAPADPSTLTATSPIRSALDALSARMVERDGRGKAGDISNFGRTTSAN